MEEIVENVGVEVIDTSKLKIGMTVKNYKVLCELLGEPVKDGKSKKYQLQNFSRFFDWEKIGQKFIISDIYTSPLDKEDGRKSGNNFGHYRTNTISDDAYKVPYEFNKTKGVYSISLQNHIYIGSTVQGFRQRYNEHCRNSMPSTYELLKNGATFQTLWIAPDEASESDVRRMEQKFIRQYLADDQYHVVNGKLSVDVPDQRQTKKTKQKKMQIIVNASDFKIAEALLKKYNIQTFRRKKRQRSIAS